MPLAPVALAFILALALAQPGPAAPASPPASSDRATLDQEQRRAEIQRLQSDTHALYERPEYRRDSSAPANAAEWYALLPGGTTALIHGPVPPWSWTGLDFDFYKPGLACGVEDLTTQAEFERAAHRLAIANAPAVELFVRASRIENCDFAGVPGEWDRPRGGPAGGSVTLTMRQMVRLVVLDARSRWSSGEHRMAMERAAAVARAGRHLASVDATAGLMTVKWAMDEASLMLDDWPEPGPAARDVRELIDALTVIDERDPCGLASSWYEQRRTDARDLIAQTRVLGSGESIAAAVGAELGVRRRDELTHALIATGIFIVRDEPLPLATMKADEIERAVLEAMPRLERVHAWMLEGGRQADIEASVREALDDPEFMEPLLLTLAGPTNRMLEEWRAQRAALVERLERVEGR